LASHGLRIALHARRCTCMACDGFVCDCSERVLAHCSSWPRSLAILVAIPPFPPVHPPVAVPARACPCLRACRSSVELSIETLRRRLPKYQKDSVLIEQLDGATVFVHLLCFIFVSVVSALPLLRRPIAASSSRIEPTCDPA